MPQDEVEQNPNSPTSRRRFLLMLGVALNMIAATLAAVPIIGSVFSTFRHTAWQAWVSLGSLQDFSEHQTRLVTYTNPFTVPWDGATAHLVCWVRRLAGDQFQVFAVNCTHLGCPVRWFPESGLFMCPCHGGVYYADGSRASGPPPRGLFTYEYTLQNGQLWVRAGQLPTLSEPV